MKHIKLFEELSNISNIRKWPSYPGREDRDIYFVYDLSKNERGKYLNVWFQGQKMDQILPPNRKRKTEVRNYHEEMITLKKVDKETASHLYNREFNPIAIWISSSYRNIGEFDMKAHMYSIDDSSYGIWWKSPSLEELKSIRSELMKWIDQFGLKNPINGEEFLNKCVELGADESTKDYN